MPYKILIVEDDSDMLDCVSQELRHRGYEVTGVDSSEDACAVLDRETFDVVLSDIHMPDVNGLEFSKILQDAKVNPARVAMSGVFHEDHEIKEAGFRAFLLKPFTAEELTQTIESVITTN